MHGLHFYPLIPYQYFIRYLTVNIISSYQVAHKALFFKYKYLIFELKTTVVTFNEIE